jgi:hypothetical protein
MINFNEGREKLNKFTGSERKRTIILDGETYMLKFPDPVRHPKFKDLLSYKNNVFSEHIGSSIFKSCGIDTQDTALGYFVDERGKEKIVVGCKDFTADGGDLYEISTLLNQITTSDEKLGPTIENVYFIIENIDLIKDKEEILSSFWDMFVVDALIGNRDRHFGNWGIIEKDGEVSFSPVYDCGSSLSAMQDDSELQGVMDNPSLFKQQVLSNVVSSYTMDGKKIKYNEIFKKPPQDLEKAILRIAPKIDMDNIYKIIDSVSAMPDVRKEYLKKAVELRYTQIILPALKRIQANEKAE